MAKNTSIRFAIDPGELDTPVVFKRDVTSVNDYGEPTTDSTTTLGTFHCKVEYAGGGLKEDYAADRQTVFGRIIVTTRKGQLDISETDYLTLDSIDYDILGLQIVGRNRFWRIVAEKRE